MSPTRRMRFGALLGLLALLTVIYITTGANQTRNSKFYTRTVSRIEHKVWEEAQLASLQKEPESLAELYLQGQDTEAPTDNLKERLKQAEQAAKESADAKWRDVESELTVATVNQAVEHVSKSTGRTPAKAEEKVEEEKVAKVPNSSAKELEQILKRSPVVIFSKTYCPYSRKAKHILLDAHSITPPPVVVELDKHERGSELQDALHEMTGRRTVPNVIVEGQSIGGGDDVEALWRSGKLRERIGKLAGSSITDVTQNTAFSDGI